MAVKKKKVLVLDKATIEKMVEEYQALKVQEKSISDRKKVLADSIKAFAVENGTKDDKGSFYSENDRFIFGASCRKSVSIDDAKAMELFYAREEVLGDCFDLKPVIVEEAIERHLSLGDITLKEIESITNVSVSMAIDVREKEEVAVVEQTSFVASKKKPLLKSKK